MLELHDTTSIEVNGTNIAVVERGSGDPVVLVHGGVSDLRSWARQVPVLSNCLRVVCYSRRYHSPNAAIPPEQPDSFQTHVDDLAALINRLGVAPTYLVGHSWGGLIALALASQQPDWCKKLVLIEPPSVSVHIQIPPKPLQLLKLFLSKPKLAFSIAKLGAGTFAPAEKAFRKGDDEAAIAYFGRGVLGDHTFKALSKERYQQVWDNRGADRAQALYHGFPDLRDAPLSRITMPVLLLSGGSSPIVFRRLNNALAEILPDATHRIIPNASHIVHEDAPDSVNAEIIRFLQR
ncbi:alpha/beta hydrolase [Pseudosulfitobacter sp. DSM 107133]|uniref:alpha/beta fold hydrolase n=1 Tax=Pseudosulfitobacter sp. DSM 107133 TaxID=2883100 RepID=UPI000DF1EB21|nr:alpha/beta hydrolase [Pseudosulfitobacter sp. DSM 107133]UOA27547.1 Fluoroacetate dehalogenase [Pseudosulfitobacter sp. DSM 107133]